MTKGAEAAPMTRGDICLVAVPGDYGKPRPAVVVQTDLLNATHASLIVCLLTSRFMNAPAFRLDVDATTSTGLQARSQIMVDKVATVRRDRVRERIGALDDGTRLRLDRALTLVLGLAG
ncbi:MAG TPA: type II toxin-antitoxin system PemK/MazF family toxin [Vicinamibacterales bacterium]|nr:type II toxin-antitoxin system PemK/MazF family toxin [Vicinamibacterales bacterium]